MWTTCVNIFLEVEIIFLSLVCKPSAYVICMTSRWELGPADISARMITCVLKRRWRGLPNKFNFGSGGMIYNFKLRISHHLYTLSLVS